MSSPTHSDPHAAASGSDTEMETVPDLTCGLCSRTYHKPKVLYCLHTFCVGCLEQYHIRENDRMKLKCPKCAMNTPISHSVEELKTDPALNNMVVTAALEKSTLQCGVCSKEYSAATAYCYQCSCGVCCACENAHRSMDYFKNHRIVRLLELQSKDDIYKNRPKNCARHVEEDVKYYCRICMMAYCPICLNLAHKNKDHGHAVYLDDEGSNIVEQMKRQCCEGREKVKEMKIYQGNIENFRQTLTESHVKSHQDINRMFENLMDHLQRMRNDAQSKLDEAYNRKLLQLTSLTQGLNSSIHRTTTTCDFVDRLSHYAPLHDVVYFKSLLDERFQNLFNFMPELSPPSSYFLRFSVDQALLEKFLREGGGSIQLGNPTPCHSLFSHSPEMLGTDFSMGNLAPSNNFLSNGHHSFFDSPLQTAGNYGTSDVNQYTQWSNGTDNIDVFQMPPGFVDPMRDLTSRVNNTTNPPRSQIRRTKMTYNTRFGEFGVQEGQFTEPSGVAVNAQNEIIVADTNNHRIQIFDKDGHFKFAFGECGKRDNQLLYPNRVAVVKMTGDIVVTERSPTHQIQIYNQYGSFIRKFGANILQHPRGVCVDHHGCIIIVECKVMRVLIFDQTGNVINKFGCSKHLQFPNSVAVNDKEEIFISDNRAHCVKVFNYQGAFLRQIGGEGLTNYPIGVGINSAGQVLVADNHNNFNLTIFSMEGTFLHALESKVKHAQCYDVALMDDNSVVLASKDYKLYVYKYND